MKEVDLRENVFTIQKEPRMLLGHCAVIKDGECLYSGQIANCPVPTTGIVIILHPDDYEDLNAYYKKNLN